MSAVKERLLSALEAHGCAPRASGDGYIARCPAHEDGQASLSIGQGDDGRALIRCHAGCDVKTICAALGIEVHELFPPRPTKSSSKKPPMDGAVLWEKLAEHDEVGEAYLKSRGLDGAIALGLVRFNVPSRAIVGEAESWLGKRAERGYRVAVAQCDSTGKVRDFQLRAVGPADPAKLSLCGTPRPPATAFGRPDLAAAGGRVFFAEGMADTLALCVAECVAIGAAGTGKLKQLAELVPEGTEAVLCVQNDKQNQSARGFLRLAARLEERGIGVRWLATPAAHKDPADWFKAIGIEAFKVALVGGAVSAQPPQTVEQALERPEFIIFPGEGHRAVAFAVAALARHPTTFQRSSCLITITGWQQPTSAATTSREDGAPIIHEVSAALLWERLSQLVQWAVLNRKEEVVPCDPPHNILHALVRRGEWEGVRPLRGLVASPVLRPDGSVLDQPGYDAATQLLFAPIGSFIAIPESPTRDDALRALAQLEEIVCDFPFAQDAHRVAWVAAALTPFARPAFRGPSPLVIFDANAPRCGKTRLAELISLLSTGRTAAKEQYTQDQDEMDKRVVAHLNAADSVVIFDNIDEPFGGRVIDSLLISDRYGGRALGFNDAKAALSLPNLTLWLATANNAQIRGDLFGRALHVRLETPLEHPEERDGFRHSDLAGWVGVERPRLAAAALTILRAWFVAGRPAFDLKPFGSFEGWSSILRNVCRWLDLPDPWMETKQGLTQADPGAPLHAALLAGIEEMDPEGQGLTTGEIKRRLEEDARQAYDGGRPLGYARLLDAMAVSGGLVRDGKVNAQRLGRRLQLLKGRHFGESVLVAEVDKHTKAPRWRVSKVADPESVTARSVPVDGGAGNSTEPAWANAPVLPAAVFDSGSPMEIEKGAV